MRFVLRMDDLEIMSDTINGGNMTWGRIAGIKLTYPAGAAVDIRTRIREEYEQLGSGPGIKYVTNGQTVTPKSDASNKQLQYWPSITTLQAALNKGVSECGTLLLYKMNELIEATSTSIRGSIDLQEIPRSLRNGKAIINIQGSIQNSKDKPFCYTLNLTPEIIYLDNKNQYKVFNQGPIVYTQTVIGEPMNRD